MRNGHFIWEALNITTSDLCFTFFNCRSVEREHAGVAGMMGAAAIGTGILAGITISCLMPLIISAPSLDWELPTFWPAYHPD